MRRTKRRGGGKIPLQQCSGSSWPQVPLMGQTSQPNLPIPSTASWLYRTKLPFGQILPDVWRAQILHAHLPLTSTTTRPNPCDSITQCPDGTITPIYTTVIVRDGKCATAHDEDLSSSYHGPRPSEKRVDRQISESTGPCHHLDARAMLQHPQLWSGDYDLPGAGRCTQDFLSHMVISHWLLQM